MPNNIIDPIRGINKQKVNEFLKDKDIKKPKKDIISERVSVTPKPKSNNSSKPKTSSSGGSVKAKEPEKDELMGEPVFPEKSLSGVEWFIDRNFGMDAKTRAEAKAKIQLHREYASSGGKIPDWAREQIEKDIPQNVREVGGEDEYVRASYETYIGYKPKPSQEALEYRFRSSRHYMTSQPVFDGKTYPEIKKDEPAVYLRRDKYGEFGLVYDVKQWKREQWEQLGKQPLGGLKQGAQAITGSFLNIFDLDYWFAKDRSKYLYEKEYRMTKKIHKGKGFESWVDVQIPAYSNVILPLAGGYAFGAGLGYLGRMGAGAVKVTGAGAKAVSSAARIVSKGGAAVLGGTYAVGEGINIGTSFARDTREGVKSVFGYASKLGLAYAGGMAGYRAISSYKAPVEISHYKVGGRPEMVTAQKYVSLFGKRVSYGPKSVGLRTDNMIGFSRGVPGSPVKPDGIAPYYSTEFGMMPSVGEPVVYPSVWNNKIFVETGEGWQPKTKIPKGFEISKKVLPKPKVYRAYETYYFFLVYKPPPIKITTKPIVKPFKKTTFDVVKPDTDISGPVNKSGKDSFTVLKQPSQKTINIVESVTKTEALTVPESLLKPVYKRVQSQLSLQEQATRSQLFYDLKKEYSFVRPSISRLSLSPVLIPEQKKVSVSAVGSLSKLKNDHVQSLSNLQGLIKGSNLSVAQVSITSSKIDYKFDYNFELPSFKIKTPRIPIPDIPFKDFKRRPDEIPPEPPGFPLGSRKKKSVYEDDSRAFNVMVKDRYIVRGKKKFEERFIKINKQPLTHKDALALGGTVVDQSAARQFKIVPTSGKPGKSSVKTSMWPFISHKFTKKQGKDVFQERTGFAIDSPGEVNEISARGWVALNRGRKSMDVINMKDMRNIVRRGKLL